ncbi:MAG: hypothetical protein CMA68_05080 [Euryarchaeota archaeon]|nr:hypothetical protein [Euryarchaeota archaeon]
MSGMDGDNEMPRLNSHQLIAVDKALMEISRKQRSSAVPVELPMANFWAAVGQLVRHLESELAETMRTEGPTAKAQLQTRKLGVTRTQVSDLTRHRLNAFTQHAILSNLLRSPEGDSMSDANGPGIIEWERHDPSERAFYSGIGHLVDKYKHEVSLNSLLRSSWDAPPPPPETPSHTAPLTEFVPGVEKSDAPEAETAPQPPETTHWEDPDYDEEDRIREMDAFPGIGTGAAPPPEPTPVEPISEMRRILVLQDMTEPIVTEDGSEITLTAGDIENCPSIIADTLIAAGMAEAADL